MRPPPEAAAALKPSAPDAATATVTLTDPTLDRPDSPAPINGDRHPWLVEARALARLAAPLVLTQLAQMAVVTTDVIMLGRLGKTPLAASAIGSTLYFLCWLMACGPASAIAAVVAHIEGERGVGAKRGRGPVRRALRMGLWSAALLCLPMALALQFAKPVFLMAHQDPGVAAGAGVFVGWLSFGLAFSVGYQALRNWATALGHAKAPLWVMGATIAYNALADYALIFGHFGLPRLGLAGSGMATASSSLFSFLVMAGVIVATPDLRAYRPWRRIGRLDWTMLKELLRLGLPIGLTSSFEAMMFNAMTWVMGAFGAGPLAAHQIALNVASITFMAPLGVALAATVRVGLFAGRGDLAGARRAGWTAMALGVGCASISGLVMITLGRPITGLYFGGRLADPEVVRLAVIFLKIAAAFQIVDAIQVVGGLCLRGLKDARMPMVLAGTAYWLIGAPACLWLAFGLHMAGVGVWIGLAIGLAAAAVLMVGRFERLTRSRPAKAAPQG